MEFALDLLIGLDQTDINPPFGLPAGGHDPPPIMDGFHDRLYVKSVSLSNRDSRILIASVDVVGLGRDLCYQLRDEISEKFGIPRENVIILATHSHSAPETNCWEVRWFHESKMENKITKFQEKLIELIQSSLMQAVRREKLVESASFSTANVRGLYTNRNDPKRKIDESISSLFIKAEGSTEGSGLMFNQHNHPTILGLGNTYYSADFPGAVSRRLSQKAGIQHSNCITGACGDVSIRQVLGDEFSPDRTYQNVVKYGNVIGDAIIESLSNAENQKDDFVLSARTKVTRLKIKSHPDENEALEIQKEISKKIETSKSTVEKRRLELGLYGMKMWSQTLEINRNLPKSIEIEFGAVYMGSQKQFVLVWAPGEILSDTGHILKEKSTSMHTFLSGYGNGYLGYFATPASFENLEYEANFTPIAQEAYDEIERALIELVAT